MLALLVHGVVFQLLVEFSLAGAVFSQLRRQLEQTSLDLFQREGEVDIGRRLLLMPGERIAGAQRQGIILL